MSMILIEKIKVEGVATYFYDGIDFDMIENHNSENEFLIFFVESYVSEIKKWKREKNINSILNGSEIKDFDHELYRNIAIYQTSGADNLIPIYKSIREKILEKPDSVFPYKIIGSSKK